jgi:hypothetical protein
MTPRDAACSAANEYSAIDRSRSCAMRGGSPTNSAAWSKSIVSSWPTSAFVEGVKIGSGSRSESRWPSGSVIPATAPVAW